MEVVYSIISGLVSGVVSSLLFFWIISLMRPNMSISNCICKMSDDKGTFYGFKILNNSRFHVLDLRIEVMLKKPFNSNGGANHTMTWLNLRRDTILQFPRYKKTDKNGDYALIVATRDPLEELWTDPSQYLHMKIHGRHSFSGITKSFDQKFYTKKNCIKDGLFNFGKTFDIS